MQQVKGSFRAALLNGCSGPVADLLLPPGAAVYEADAGLPVSILSIERLGVTEVTPLHLLLLILEDGHSSLHPHEAELSIERLLAGDRVQDDFLVVA